MRDQLTNQNLSDFNQRYNGTFGWYEKDDGQKQLIYITDVSSQHVTFEDKEGFSYRANINGGVVFDFIPATRGWYNTDTGEVYFICRVPRRQWHRGICASNHAIYSAELGPQGLVKIPDREYPAIIFQVFSSTTTNNQSFKSYLQNKNQTAVALSQHFALVDKEVYFLSRVIGEWDREKQRITLTDTLNLRQELSDVIRRNNLNIECVS